MKELMRFLYGDLDYPTGVETRGHKPYLTIYKDKLTCKFSGKRRYHDPGSVLGNACAPKDCVLYYFEVEILHSETPANIVVGFSKPNHYHNRHPGSQPNSVGYHGENGNRTNGTGKCVSYGLSYGKNDIVGCGINYIDQTYFFTRNGKSQGKAGTIHYCDNYPIVGLGKTGDIVKFNFEGPFKYDIKREYMNLMYTERREINKHLVDRGTLNRVIYLYLLHRGYKKTLDSFKKESGISIDSRGNNQCDEPCTVCSGDNDEDSSIIRGGTEMSHEPHKSIYISDSTIARLESSIEARHQICQLIKSGDTAQALITLDNHYPSIDKSSYAYCLLLGQHFLELVKDNQEEHAIAWFKSTFDISLTNKKKYKKLVEDTLGILCCKDLENEALKGDFYQCKRLEVANGINNLLLDKDVQRNSLRGLVQFVTMGRELIKENHGRTGPEYTPSYICQPLKADP